MSSSPSILVVGTGALACLFSARFAAAGIPVTLLGTWPEGIVALRANGVRLIETDGGEQVYPIQVVTEPSDCREILLALVLVKSWQTERAARQLRDCLHPRGLALSLQNGLGNRQKLGNILGEARVAQGVTTTGATLIAPGVVRSGGEGTISVAADDPRLGSLLEIFQRAGFTVEGTAQIQSLIWGKLAVNAAINPLTALLRVPNGDLLNQPSTRALMALTAREVEALASARKIQLPFEDVVTAVEEVARRTSGNFSSMLQDVLRAAPTEIDAINGAVVRAAEGVEISTPVNRTLWLLVKSLVNQHSYS